VVTAKLIGESDGHTVSRTFEHQGDAIKWLRGAGLREFADQTARVEVWADNKLVWTHANLQIADARERDRIAYATRWRAGGFYR